MERVETLRHVLFFKMLPDDALHELADAGKEQRLQKGETLFVETQKCLGLIVVMRGAVRVYKLDSRGREMTLDRELPGESVLELPLFDGGNYPANAEAAEQETVILIIPSTTVITMISTYPQIALYALKALGVRTRKLIATVEAQSLQPVRARLAAYLLACAGGQDHFVLPETHEEIAAHIGTVREVVSRTLHSFKEAGTLTLNGREVTLLDEHVLRRILDGSH